MHSFESLHTADEYQGGYRVSDGSDELTQHQNALDELHLESVTRGGDAASSVYRAMINGFFEILDSTSKRSKGVASLLYPEWDYKQGILKKDHCRLYFTDKLKVKDPKSGHQWLRNLREKQSREIGLWKKRFECLANRENWVNRQWEGAEVDLESYINFCGDITKGNAREAPLYMKQKKDYLETACLLLFDQSFSTDSWVKNQRILDLELESIGLTGLLTQSIIPSIAVAGTWSETRNHCYYHVYKDFNEDWSEFYKQAPGVNPMGYTRLGPSIRHSIEKLCSIKARQRLLILLTDGKPTDYDRYEGRYGIEDVRHGIRAAKDCGIYTRAFTLEKKHEPHLPQIFGEGGYSLLNDTSSYPEILWEICSQI